MQNAFVAQVFDDIADYLELAGDNPFKIRAYRRAAEAVANYEEPIEDAAEAGTLRDIEGLGEATVAKAQEFLATGSVRLLDRLREQYPEGLFELLRIPNLGSKKVAQLYKERQIDSVERLVQALDNDELKGLSGFGPKTIENIRRGLERMAEMSERLPLAAALGIATQLAEALQRNSPAAGRVELAGSLRRGCDTAGNINLVACTATPGEVIEAFTALPAALSVQERNASDATICVRPGIAVQLRCADAESFGLLWYHVTGSAAHLEVARERAARLGLELRAAGLWRGDEPLLVREEAELFRILGVPFIPPELREDRGEWLAAEAGHLPDLVTTADLKGDLHAHSTWSDGVATIRQMAAAAQDRGYQYLAITDHSKALAMANGLNADRLREQAKEIAEVQAEIPEVRLLRGVECDIMRDGSLDLDDEVLHELDIVVASVHSGFNLDEAAQTARMVRAASHPAVDIMAHPTGRVLAVRPGYQVDVAALIEAAREHGTALEINASERLDLRDTHAYAAREASVSLSIDSDAHSPRMLPNVMYGVMTARRAWCEAADILNAKPVEELLKWLRR